MPILDQYGKPVTNTKPPKPFGGVRITQNDRTGVSEVSKAFTPAKVASIIETANAGDQRNQAKLCQEILEKDWDIMQAIGTRAAAVKATEWEINPADDSTQAKKVAEFVENALDSVENDFSDTFDSFEQMIENISASSFLPGFSVQEIAWLPGGAGIQGYQHIDAHHFTFKDAENQNRPMIVTDEYQAGKELELNKYIIHRHRARAGDIVRSGLIRPLAWLYAFKNLNVKDLLRYIEKFGMPFVAAFLNDNAWEKERTKIAYLIQNFGSDGGGVFTEATRLEFLNSQDSSAGELYFKFLKYCEKKINQIVLGQTSTADSESSNRSTASVHDEVRQDLREDDCKSIARTIRKHLIRPLVAFNFPAGTPIPEFKFLTEPPEDLAAFADVVQKLSGAGYQAEDDFIEEKFGIKLKKTIITSPVPPGESPKRQAPGNTQALAALKSDSALEATDQIIKQAHQAVLAGDDLKNWVDPLAKALAKLQDTDDAAFAAEMQSLLASIDTIYGDMVPAEFEQTLQQTIYNAMAEGVVGKSTALSAKE